jgi:hypothetical protein
MSEDGHSGDESDNSQKKIKEKNSSIDVNAPKVKKISHKQAGLKMGKELVQHLILKYYFNFKDKKRQQRMKDEFYKDM